LTKLATTICADRAATRRTRGAVAGGLGTTTITTTMTMSFGAGMD
jgi:hypothetical protein